MGKSLLDLQRIDLLSDVFDEIRNVSATQLQDLANEVFDEKVMVLDVSKLTNGVYLLRVDSGSFIEMNYLVKE